MVYKDVKRVVKDNLKRTQNFVICLFGILYGRGSFYFGIGRGMCGNFLKVFEHVFC